MLTIEARPRTFSEEAGQHLAKTLLRAIIKNPENSPKSIILYGPFGCAKTTNARILARSLNCEHRKSNGDPCLKCSSCLENLEQSPFYAEYDSSMLKLETVRNLMDTWYTTLSKGYTVRVIDECHALSKQVQTALLKTIEEPPKNTFFVFATTNIEDVLPTIRSRSLEVPLSTVSPDDMRENLIEVASNYSIEVDEEVINRIIQNSKGHMRNAHMNLEMYSMVGKEQYLQLSKSAIEPIKRYFIAIAQRNKDLVFKSLDEIFQYPLSTIEEDFKNYIKEIAKSLVSEPNELCRMLGPNTLKLIKLCISDWFTSCFSSDIELQTALLCVYQIMVETVPQKKVQSTQNLNARR